MRAQAVKPVNGQDQAAGLLCVCVFYIHPFYIYIHPSFGFPARLLSCSMLPSKVLGYLVFNGTLASFTLLAVAIGGSFGPLAVACTTFSFTLCTVKETGNGEPGSHQVPLPEGLVSDPLPILKPSQTSAGGLSGLLEM